MARIQIDGVTYECSNLAIRNGRVIVDGKFVDREVSGVVEVRILEGVLQNLETDASVSCGRVTGDVVASGSVTCGDIGGSVQAGGSVHANGRLNGGSVMAGGSVKIG